jgi:hypothetical protein
MKKLFFLLLILPILLNAQIDKWHPFPENQTAFFKSEGYSHALHVIIIDSIHETESGNVYFNRRDPLHIETTEDYQLYDPYQSWIGYSTLVDNEKAVFQNKDEELMTIYLDRENQEPWLFYTYENGDYIKAWVEQVQTMNILEDLKDEVKIFNFQKYDAAGSVIEDDINSDSLVLSKNYGFVRTYQWVEFPRLYHYYNWGIEKKELIYGEKWDLDELSAGYNIGDIIHLEFNEKYRKIDEYIDKTLTDDYVEYTVKTTTQDYESISYETRRYNFGDLPMESKFGKNGKFLGFKLISVSSTPFQGEHKYEIFTYDNFEWVEYEGNYYWGREWNTGTGSGPFEDCNVVHYYENSCNGDGDCYDIVYFNNGEEWGIPLEFSVDDYSMIRPDQTNIFSNNDILGIRIDTIESQGYGAFRYYSYASGQKYLYDEERNYVDPQGSWIGMYIDITIDGITTFYNERYEPIVFYPNKELGYTWQVYNQGNWDVWGNIHDIEYQEILPELMDSVKTIQIYSIDKNDTAWSETLRLSKHYGLLDIPQFYSNSFKYIRSIKSIKTTNDFYGFDYPIDEILMSLEVGNQVHYEYPSNDLPYLSKRETIEKIVQPQKVQYIMEECRYYDIHFPSDTNYYANIIDTIEFPIHIMPGELISDTNIFGSEFYMNIVYDSTDDLCEDLAYVKVFPYHRSTYVEKDGRTLLAMSMHNGFEEDDRNVFVDNIGYYRAFQHDTERPYDEIYYFSSPEVECGEPYAFSCNTGLENIDHTSVDVYPNPTNGLFYINSSEKIEEVKIYTINGQMVLNVAELNEQETVIDFSHQARGIYFIKLYTSNGVIVEKIVIE